MAAGTRHIEEQPELDLRVLRRSRKKPKAGDVFAMLARDDRFLFGRVISADLPIERSPWAGANLIYIYNVASNQKEPPLDKLTIGRLILPPMFINNSGWLRGYFETVHHAPLTQNDLLPRHCFLRAANGKYLDEFKRTIASPVEPCGEWSMANIRILDEELSEALSFRRG